MSKKMLEKIRNVVDYITFITTEFALKYKITFSQSFNYLNNYGGIAFLDKHYNYEHTQNPVYTLEAVQKICKCNGGNL